MSSKTETTTTTPRITTGYCEGTRKDIPGYSDVMRGERIPKSDPACGIHALSEHVRISALRSSATLTASWILYDQPAYTKALKLFGWLAENSFSLSSFAFSKGNTSRHIFPDGCVADLEAAIVELKARIEDETGKSADTDFVLFDSPASLTLDELRIQVRDLEREYVRWMYDPRVVSDLYSHMSKDIESALVRFDNTMLQYHFLNRLSSYIFWFTRYYSIMEYKATGLETKIKEWQSKVAPGGIFE